MRVIPSKPGRIILENRRASQYRCYSIVRVPRGTARTHRLTSGKDALMSNNNKMRPRLGRGLSSLISVSDLADEPQSASPADNSTPIFREIPPQQSQPASGDTV